MNTTICLWTHQNNTWILHDHYTIDQDGYATSPTKHNSKGNRHSYANWLKDTPPGQLITIWTPEHGVKLLELNPPQHPNWLNHNLYNHLKKQPNWYALIENGHTIHQTTANIATKQQP